MEKYIVVNILHAVDNLTKKEMLVIVENSRNYDVKMRLKRYFNILFTVKLMKQFLSKNEEQKRLTCEHFFLENKIKTNVIYM